MKAGLRMRMRRALGVQATSCPGPAVRPQVPEKTGGKDLPKSGRPEITSPAYAAGEELSA
jgi:hypothetical protein